MINDKPQGGFLMSKIHQTAGRIFNKLLKKYNIEDINSAQGRILFVLWQKDGINIKELSEKTSLEKSTLTSMLDRLENKGHLERKAVTGDRRSINIHLTEKNKIMHNNYNKVSDEMNDLFYKDFSDEEIDAFENKLKKILSNLSLY